MRQVLIGMLGIVGLVLAGCGSSPHPSAASRSQTTAVSAGSSLTVPPTTTTTTESLTTTTTTAPPPPPTTTTTIYVPPTTAAPAGCHPLSDEGTCYEPGEYCRDDDHGASGVAGDGEAIMCEDNDGWRWEPS